MEQIQRPPRYRLYLDESGDHTTTLLESEAHRFLGLLGVWFEQSAYVKFADELTALKREFFGARPDSPVVLHRSDIINSKGAFFRLRDPAFRQKFDDHLLQLIAAAEFTLICVVIDKKRQPDRYAQLASPFSLHPNHFCLAAILYRYSKWLLSRNAVGDIVAESRGGREDRQLKNAYRNIFESGTKSLSHEAYRRALTSKDVKLEFKRSCIAGLELADILAHPMKAYCLASKELVTQPVGPFASKLQIAVHSKFLQGPKGAENHGWMCF